MSRSSWLLAGLATLAPASARATPPDPPESSAAPSDSPAPVARERAGPPPTRLELGLFAGDYVYTVGSATQLRYAPAFDLRLAYGLARIGALGFFRVAAPPNVPGSLATEVRQVATGGGLGLRSLFVQRRRVRFGVWLTASVDRLDSVVRLPALPGLDEPEHGMRRVTHHAGLGIGHELGIVLPTTRGPTAVLTLGTSLAFVFPIAASRSGTDVAPTRYRAGELGIVSALGGATILAELGVMLGWDFAARSRRAAGG